ncbi:mannose-1-phosphate guanylyltransferase/mannose-6-phosphate isomerase [Solilutibacter tolerans]|uniref:Xanthan biosynthesis protein XanB n=1 Tax=Solilutibacter tolerans TaxID=1604334 RepID=A0A1N6N8I2_9GAMM|nr:mannose-1-phosphate guanylyltransferase/mannose-6-phosphate isomerase [Lysobacter tolerans]SIP88393.1 mannose-1-phosphate guanylyltransferase / mannose-6-phosphate isomerase [Lysobacter tolerans]
MLHPVILSGGSGTRLWPRSRSNTPKQFLPLVGDETLLQATALRVKAMQDVAPVITVCAEDHRFMVGEQLQAIGMPSGGILLEPAARNTAPAIALAALHVQQQDAQGVMLVLPADHLIRDEPAFRDAVMAGLAQAHAGALVTFGIKPDAPVTGYGYIRIGQPLDARVHAIGAFVEKPDVERARTYLDSGEYLWNSGMFLFRADAYLEALKKHAPAILVAARAAYDAATGDLDFIRVDADAFATSPSDSIDYAVMERATNAAVVPVDCGWSDVGSWSSLWEVADRDVDGNVQLGDTLAIDTGDSYLQAADDRLVAALGVRDLIVVDTADAVLVAHRDRVQDVKMLVDRLKAEGRTEHLHHRKVYRPWGSYDSLAVGPGFQVKRIVVKPGAALSLQRHQRRAEHWIVVSGTAEVTCNDKVFDLGANQSTYIPLGSKHRLRNTTDQPVELIEVQSGDYLGEDDIERFDDVYGRT